MSGAASAAHDDAYYRRVRKTDIRLALAGAGMYVDALEREHQTTEFFSSASKSLKTKQDSDYQKAKSAYEDEWQKQQLAISTLAAAQFRMYEGKKMYDNRQLVRAAG